jgi:hypothetical protein
MMINAFRIACLASFAALVFPLAAAAQTGGGVHHPAASLYQPSTSTCTVASIDTAAFTFDCSEGTGSKATYNVFASTVFQPTGMNFYSLKVGGSVQVSYTTVQKQLPATPVTSH